MLETTDLIALVRAEAFPHERDRDPWLRAAVGLEHARLMDRGPIAPTDHQRLSRLGVIQDAEKCLQPFVPASSNESVSESIRLLAAHRCLELHPEVVGGDGLAIMECVSLCLAHQLIAPGWLAEEFVNRQRLVERGEAKGWGDDAAFGSGVPKGTNRAGVYASKSVAPMAWAISMHQVEVSPDAPIDVLFWDQVADELANKTGDRFSGRRLQTLVRHYCDQCPDAFPFPSDIALLMRCGLSFGEAHARLADDYAKRHFIESGGAEDAWAEYLASRRGADSASIEKS